MADTTRILLHFDELVDEVLPSDAAGGLVDLTVPAGLTLPAVILDGEAHGRTFTLGRAFEAVDDAGGDGTILTRDLTIQTLIRWDIAAQLAAGTPGAIIVRGDATASAEYHSFGVELNALSATQGELVAYWQTLAGVMKTQVGAPFAVLSNGWLLLTMTRRWISPTSVEVCYYANGALIGTVASVDGDIGGGTTGKTSVGARYDFGAGGWVDALEGDIDEIRVTDYPMAAEEIAADWHRIAVEQPQAILGFRDLLPPGFPISDDPASSVQKLITIAGVALGHAAGKAAEARNYGLPDRAYGETLERWEAILGHTPGPRDSVATRRARLAAFLSRKAGYSHASVKAALEGLLDTEAANLPILEYQNKIEDDFATAINPQRWWAEPAAKWSIASGALRLQGLSGDDWRFDTTRANSPFCLTSVTHARDLFAQVVVNVTTVPNDCLAGIQLFDFTKRNALWFGYAKIGGAHRIAMLKTEDGVSSGLVQLVAVAGDDWWFRLRRRKGASLLQFGRDYWDFEYSADGITWNVAGTTDWISRPTFCGPGAMSTGTTLGAVVDLTFDDFLLHTPYGTRPFRWYMYRNPALPGSPDFEGASLAISRIKPAHTIGQVITSTSLLCDDATTGCDRTPMGGI